MCISLGFSFKADNLSSNISDKSGHLILLGFFYLFLFIYIITNWLDELIPTFKGNIREEGSTAVMYVWQ